MHLNIQIENTLIRQQEECVKCIIDLIFSILHALSWIFLLAFIILITNHLIQHTWFSISIALFIIFLRMNRDCNNITGKHWIIKNRTLNLPHKLKKQTNKNLSMDFVYVRITYSRIFLTNYETLTIEQSIVQEIVYVRII